MLNKPAVTSQPIHDLLASRWSPRAFDSDAVITREQILALAEAARWAPSCFGAEPWSFVFCDRTTDQAGWERALASLADLNQAWAKSCPLLIAAVAHRNFDHNNKPNRHYTYDTGAASFSLVLQAEALGLRAHQMGGFDPAKAAESMQVPDDAEVISMIAVGRQLGPDAMPEGEMRDREAADRTRKELGKVFFAGLWNTSLDGS